MQHFLIIGSGLIGRLLAWRLIRQGHQVDILSKDDFLGSDSAGYIAASMISPATEAINTEPVVKTIGMASLNLWPQWLAELPEPIFYQNNGTLVVAHAGDQSEKMRFIRRAQHILHDEDYRLLNHQQLAEQSPCLAQQFNDALFFPNEASLDNRQLYAALTNVLQKSSLCRWQQCEAIEHLSEKVIQQLALKHFGATPAQYQSTIDCRGNGAKQDISDFRSVRGEVIRVHAPDVHFKQAIRLLHPRYPFYLAPRPNNEYFLGATVIESDDMSPVSVRSGLELMSALYTLHKGFAEARILEMASHCRPTTINNLPMVKRTEWGYQINGFYRHGYLFSPAIITDLLHVLNDNKAPLNFGEFFDV